MPNWSHSVWSLRKVVPCSRGVLAELKEMFGNKYGSLMNELLTSNMTFSDETSPHPTKSITDMTSCHPEFYLNVSYRGNNFEWACDLLDRVWTTVLQYLYCDESKRCTAGRDIFEEVKNSPAYLLMKEACRQALNRMIKLVRRTSKMYHEGRFLFKSWVAKRLLLLHPKF